MTLRQLTHTFRLLRFRYVHQKSIPAFRRYQERQLHKLVTHAGANVRIYRELFASSGVDPSSIHTLKDLECLPIMNKDSYLGRPVNELLNADRYIRSVWRNTSGTSGKPFSILSSYLLTIPSVQDFAMYRFYFWDHPLTWDVSSIPCARIKVASSPRPNRLVIPVSALLERPADVVNALAAFKPVLLESYPSLLLELARSLENTSLPRFRVPYIVAVGEMLSDTARRQIELRLGGAVFDRYGAEEVGAVACECREHDGMHVNVESVIVEILDDTGSPVPEGGMGRVVVTDLLNYNMPFIRYDTGDRGSMVEQPCACGLRTPRIRIEGRYTGFLRIGDRVIHHLEIDGALDSCMNQIIQYQVAKMSETEFEVRVIPGPSFSPAAEERIRSNVKAVLGSRAHVTVVRVDAIRPTPQGKSRIIVDESGTNK